MQFSRHAGGTGYLRERLGQYLNTPIRIFGKTLPRGRWLGFSLTGAALLSVYGILSFAHMVARNSGPSDWSSLAFLGAGALAGMFWFYMVLRTFRVPLNAMILFTLLLAGASFTIEIGLLNSELIGRLTPRAMWALGFVFAALALYPLHARLPRFALPVLAGIYILGALLCIPFIGPMLPFMAFGWMAIPFAGVGFLPYSPLLSVFIFSAAARGIYRFALKRNMSDTMVWSVRGAMLTVALACSAYSGWFLLEWNHMNNLVDDKKKSAPAIPARLDGDLPRWTALAARFPDHHAARMYLSERSRDRIMRMGIARGDFDPLSYTAHMLLDRAKLKPDERGRMYALITGDEHSNLQRLWSGKNLRTTHVKTHVQIFPETRTAYTETTLVVHNDADRTREAIYTLRLPEGSAASQLSLWINGKEEPARLALKEKARAAYRRIVGVEKRDPALLEWREGSRMRLRVFPVFAGKSRKVKFGIVSPLKREWTSESAVLALPAIRIIGTELKHADHELTFDLVSPAGDWIRGRGIDLKETIRRNGLRRFHVKSSYNQDWRIQVNAPERIEGRFIVGKDAYIVEAAETAARELFPDDIYLLISDALPRKDWIRAYREIAAVKSPRARVIIAGREKFSTENEAAMIAHLRTVELSRLNLFPFYGLPRGRRALVVSAGGTRSPTISDLAGSRFHERITKYFANRAKPVYAATLNGSFSSYLNGLIEFDRVRAAAYSRTGLIRVLRTNKMEIPAVAARGAGFAFPRSGMRIRRIPVRTLKALQTRGSSRGAALHPVSLAKRAGNTPGGDTIARLFMYRELMGLIGRSHFRAQSDKKAAMRIAADAMLVSPVSSLVVLESLHDYRRFGIEKKKSKLGQSKTVNPALGLVPEPEEWALMILVLLVLAWLRREQIAALLRKINPPGRLA